MDLSLAQELRYNVFGFLTPSSGALKQITVEPETTTHNSPVLTASSSKMSPENRDPEAIVPPRLGKGEINFCQFAFI